MRIDFCNLCEQKLKEGSNEALFYCSVCNESKDHQELIKNSLGIDLTKLEEK
jgi:hypothetical protein